MPSGDLTHDAAYLEGLRLFNEGAFFESHEKLEEVWQRASQADRFFLQAVIHFAVAMVLAERGNVEGGRRQIDKCARKLAGYLPRYGGLDTWALYGQAVRFREAFRGRVTMAEAPWVEAVAANPAGERPTT